MGTKLHKNGKLLLTGEYAVLDGAVALAVPTRFGQDFHIEYRENSENLFWSAIDHKGKPWFEAQLNLESSRVLHTSDQDLAQALLKVLNAAVALNPDFIPMTYGARIESRLDFPRQWGLGSSSTLIAAVAQWSKTDPFSLSRMSFGGSGYDVAAANMTQPFTYKIDHEAPQINPVHLNWPFQGQLYFIYRNQKQNSRESIAHYRNKSISTGLVQDISALTHAMIQAREAMEFATLMQEHEQMIAKTLGLKPIKEELFKDFPGAIKSLGGWGGDFIMALYPEVSDESDPAQQTQKTSEYFSQRGFQTVIPYREMILG
jgi:mevalonate kinase